MEIQLVIIDYILWVGQAGRPVSLSHMRKYTDIHPATMYDHINRLIDAGYIDRVGRDQYVMSDTFTDAVIAYYNPGD